MSVRGVEPLFEAGLGAVGAEQAARLLNGAAVVLGCQPACAWWVPGRVEVLGKHTDYAGGRVLNCATDLGLVIAAVPRRDGTVTVTSAGRRLELPLSADLDPVTGWGTYVAAVVRRMARHFPGMTTGADIAITANLPPAAGMSSSSAMVTALHHVLARVNRLEERDDYRAAIASPDDLVLYLGCHENGASFRHLAGDQGVGTAGGSQDHAAIVRSRCQALNVWSFAPLGLQATVAWPKDLILAVAVSGVVAEKTTNARERYNRVAARARDAVAAWNRASGSNDANLGYALAHAPAADVLATMGNPDLHLRTAQLIAESQEIIPACIAALGRNDLATFGAQVARSQALAESNLFNQVPETTALVRLALEHGAVAASAFGAGFGGSVWAAFPEGCDRSKPWLAAYRTLHPAVAPLSSVHCVRPGPGITALHDEALGLAAPRCADGAA